MTDKEMDGRNNRQSKSYIAPTFSKWGYNNNARCRSIIQNGIDCKEDSACIGFMYLTLFSPRGRAAGYPWGISVDNFNNLGSHSPPLGKYVVSKITWTSTGNQIVL